MDFENGMMYSKGLVLSWLISSHLFQKSHSLENEEQQNHVGITPTDIEDSPPDLLDMKEELPPPDLPDFLEVSCAENPFFKPVGHDTYLTTIYLRRESPKTAEFQLSPDILRHHLVKAKKTCIVLRCFPCTIQGKTGAPSVTARWRHSWPKNCLVQVNNDIFVPGRSGKNEPESAYSIIPRCGISW